MISMSSPEPSKNSMQIDYIFQATLESLSAINLYSPVPTKLVPFRRVR